LPLTTNHREQTMEIMRIAKINAINFAQKKYKIKTFVSGIRKDEHEARSKETYFSKRSTHTRVHPILDFTIDDVWEYIKTYNVPYVSLYDQGYKSLGEKPFTKPVKNKNASERAGREATKEKTMERLRSLGYW
ncbi:MAG: phosphoadenosine phosphosulfate reductase family protein, partial [Bacteroidales bacterium]|nr:phosphoadenosine phosphosulfate reductase family protein [Bacteroidales bacterium]